MAKTSFKATPTASGGADTVGLPDIAGSIVYTTFAADLATLVADGATPTQAHVTTVNGDWTALKALIDAAIAQATGTVTVTVDKGTVTSMNKLRAALAAIEFAARQSGEFTA